MALLEKFLASDVVFDIDRTLNISKRDMEPGPPKRIDGMTLGIITMVEDAPHNGELHPDGDELLYVISGRLRVCAESDPTQPIELSNGEACIVRKGEWHKVDILEPTQLMHLTPGPNGDHRPLTERPQ